jgi:hypothetical protein
MQLLRLKFHIRQILADFGYFLFSNKPCKCELHPQHANPFKNLNKKFLKSLFFNFILHYDKDFLCNILLPFLEQNCQNEYN